MGGKKKSPVSVSTPKVSVKSATSIIPTAKKVATNVSQGKVNPFNAKGGSLGKWDKLGNALDKANPYVSGARKKEEQIAKIKAETGAQPTLGGSGAGAMTYKSTLDKDGNLVDKYKVATGPAVSAGNVTAGSLDVNALGADPRALDAMRSRALGGDSPWLGLQLQKQGLEETSARDAAARQSMSGAAAARSQLAMRGGLGSGASQRVAMQSARDMNAARQGIGRAGQLDRLNLAVADDQTKMGLLGQTAGLDLATAGQKQDMSKFNIGTALDADKFNTGNALDAAKFNSSQTYDANKTNTGNAIGGVQGENAFNMGKFQTDMMGYAAGKQGEAIAKGGGKK